MKQHYIWQTFLPLISVNVIFKVKSGSKSLALSDIKVKTMRIVHRTFGNLRAGHSETFLILKLTPLLEGIMQLYSTRRYCIFSYYFQFTIRMHTIYTLGEPNPDSLSTMRVRIRLSQSVLGQLICIFNPDKILINYQKFIRIYEVI